MTYTFKGLFGAGAGVESKLWGGRVEVERPLVAIAVALVRWQPGSRRW